MAADRVVEVMDHTNVKTVVILTGMWGDKLQHVIDEMVKPLSGAVYGLSPSWTTARSTIRISARRWSFGLDDSVERRSRNSNF